MLQFLPSVKINCENLFVGPVQEIKICGKGMNILFGLPNTTHYEIGQSEIVEFENSGIKTEVCDYGNGGAATGFSDSIKLLLKNAFQLKKRARIHESDIVYLNTGLDFKTLIRDSITIFILKHNNNQLKVVLKIHGSRNDIVFSKSNLLKNYIFKKADLLLVLSQEERNNIISVGVPSNRVKVTANVIDRDLYVPDHKFKNHFHLSEHTKILLFVGRFIKEKGILDMIKACKLLKDNHTEFHLFCLGDGPLFGEVNRLMKGYDLNQNITILGHIPEMETRKYYSNCDILILPTYHPEGFPMAVFQAVAAGKPIITTRIRAAADYFKEFENCLWVDKKNPEHLFLQILSLLNDDDLRNSMRRNNLNLTSRFSAEKIVNKLLDYFKEI